VGAVRPTLLSGQPVLQNFRVEVCTANGHYDPIDLEAIPDDYLPRTNYHPMADHAEYLQRTPMVPWREIETVEMPWEELQPGEQAVLPGQPGQKVTVQRARNRRVTEYFRLVSRTMIGPASERTLQSTIMPPIRVTLTLASQSQPGIFPI